MYEDEIMKLVPWIACLYLICGVALSEEPKGGLVDKALFPSDLGDQWRRGVQYLLDPQASPSDLFRVATNSPRGPALASEDAEALIARQQAERRGFAVTNLARLGAEAQIILEYYDSRNSDRFSIQIYRYKTIEGLEDMWKRRQASSDFNSTRTAGEDVVYTRAGQRFPGGVKASKPSVEAREGVYHVMVSPGEPKLDDPGFILLKKQLDKLRNGTQPIPTRNAVEPRP
jgi:hypothetical protein